MPTLEGWCFQPLCPAVCGHWPSMCFCQIIACSISKSQVWHAPGRLLESKPSKQLVLIWEFSQGNPSRKWGGKLFPYLTQPRLVHCWYIGYSTNAPAGLHPRLGCPGHKKTTKAGLRPAHMPDPNPLSQAAQSRMCLLMSPQFSAASRGDAEPSRFTWAAATLPRGRRKVSPSPH